MNAEIIEKLKENLKDREEILLAFIFGSAVSDRLTAESDIDIGLLFDKSPDFQRVLKIAAELSDVIGRQADIVVLNGSSPVIRMQILKNGKLLKRRDSAIYDAFHVRTVKEYDDLKLVRREAEKNILKGKIYA